MSQLVIGPKGSTGAAGDLHIYFAKSGIQRRHIKNGNYPQMRLAFTPAGT